MFDLLKKVEHGRFLELQKQHLEVDQEFKSASEARRRVASELDDLSREFRRTASIRVIDQNQDYFFAQYRGLSEVLNELEEKLAGLQKQCRELEASMQLVFSRQQVLGQLHDERSKAVAFDDNRKAQRELDELIAMRSHRGYL